MTTNPTAEQRRADLITFALCLSLFMPSLDEAVTVRYERWKAQHICTANHFDYAVNVNTSGFYPHWACEVQGPIAASGIEQTMSVDLSQVSRFDVEAMNFRRNGAPERD